MKIYTYVMSSARSCTRPDEAHNLIMTTKALKVGESLKLDGIRWTVEKIVKEENVL